MSGFDLSLYMDIDRLGASIRTCRMLREMSVAELAKRASVSEANLRAIESGDREPSLSCYVRLTGALGVSPALLLASAEKRFTELKTLEQFDAVFVPD